MFFDIGGIPLLISPEAQGSTIYVQTNNGLMPLNIPIGGGSLTIGHQYVCKHCRAGPFNEPNISVTTQSEANRHHSFCQLKMEFEQQKERDLAEQRRLEQAAAEAKRKAEEASKREAELRNAVNYIDHLRF